MWSWFKRLFWKRCFYCGEKKEWFYYTWELPGWCNIETKTDDECEVCTDCAQKRPEDIKT